LPLTSRPHDCHSLSWLAGWLVGCACAPQLANTLFAAELHRREALAGTGVVACSLHPGNFIATDIGRGNRLVHWAMQLGGLLRLTKSVSQGAATTMLCALVPAQALGGGYWADCTPALPSWRARGELGARAARTLWRLSEKLVEEAAAAAAAGPIPFGEARARM
jgi:hypothetical protein